MKRFLITLVVLALVVFAGFKGGAWLLADSRFAMARDALAPEGVLRRGSVNAHINGELTIKQVYYQPHELMQPLHADVLRYRAGSPIDLVSSLYRPGRLPGQWQLEAEALSLALSESMTKEWVMPRTASDAGSVLAPLCGRGEDAYLSMGDLMAMGMSALTGEASLRQTADALYFELNTAAAGSMELAWAGARLDATAPGAVTKTTSEPIVATLRDAGLMRKLSAYCARESGLSLSLWVASVTDAFEETLKVGGYKPSPQLKALMGRWFRDGGVLEAKLHPGQPMLGLPIRDEQAGGASGLALQYNEAVVPRVYLTRVTSQSEALAEAKAKADSEAADTESGEADWRSASAATAARWLGRMVRVNLENGKTVSGRLATVAEERLTIARTMEGGEVAYPVILKEIETFEVWRRPSDAGRPLPAPPADGDNTGDAQELQDNS